MQLISPKDKKKTLIRAYLAFCESVLIPAEIEGPRCELRESEEKVEPGKEIELLKHSVILFPATQ